MFIGELDGRPVGIVHLVGKRQGTYKISPIIVSPSFQGKRGIGSALLRFAENYARQHNARQMYCTVAEQNNSALQFFLRNGYVIAGRSDSHYKLGITELMLYKLFVTPSFEQGFDRPNISVLAFEERHETQIRNLLLSNLRSDFGGIEPAWVDALFEGYKRRHLADVNLKYKLIYVAIDRTDTVLGVAGATPKKGEPIKLMPFIATTLPAFVALLTDVPYALRAYGRKLYMHITPSVEQTIALQQRGWKLDAAMPAAYHDERVTQQWSLDISGEDFMRTIRVKQHFFDLIKAGSKTLEVRVAYDQINTIQPGERLRLATRTETQIIRVKDVRRYSNFEQMLAVESPERIAPGQTEAEVLRLLKDIYPPNREALGVIVLELESVGRGGG